MKETMPLWISNLFSSTGIQTIAALISAAATVASATFAWFIYRLGQAQLRTFDRQADLAADQARIAERQASIASTMVEQEQRLLVLTQRPRLIIDRVGFMGDDAGQFPASSLPTVVINLVNTGGTTARILRTGCMFYFDGAGLPPRVTYKNANEGPLFNLRAEAIIAPGEAVETYYRGLKQGENQLVNQAVLSPQLAEDLNVSDGPSVFMVIGHIEYVDEVGIIRHVRFARRWDGGARRFTIVCDPDFEREA